MLVLWVCQKIGTSQMCGDWILRFLDLYKDQLKPCCYCIQFLRRYENLTIFSLFCHAVLPPEYEVRREVRFSFCLSVHRGGEVPQSCLRSCRRGVGGTPSSQDGYTPLLPSQPRPGNLPLLSPYPHPVPKPRRKLTPCPTPTTPWPGECGWSRVGWFMVWGGWQVRWHMAKGRGNR